MTTGGADEGKTALDLAAGTWKDAIKLVDRTIGTLTGADVVEASAIRRILEAHEWDFPPSYDRAAAQRAGYRDLVAPASSYLTFALPPYWAPGVAPLGSHVIPPLPFREVPGEGSIMIATNLLAWFSAPIHVGDRLSITYWLRSVTPKTTRVGTGAFLVFEARFTNQRDELVVREKTTTFRYEPEPHPTSARGVASTANTANAPKGSQPVPEVSIDLTLQRLVMAAGANRDFAPLHHDPRMATSAGFAVPFANSMFVATHFERTASEWAGWESRTAHLELTLLRPAASGTTMTAAGWAEPATADDQGSAGRTACHLVAHTGMDVTSTCQLLLDTQVAAH